MTDENIKVAVADEHGREAGKVNPAVAGIIAEQRDQLIDAGRMLDSVKQKVADADRMLSAAKDRLGTSCRALERREQQEADEHAYDPRSDGDE